MCDFNTGFRVPEMVKRRPVVVISPKIKARPRLCT
ncbi:MAG: type II toxin-antitoxin system PemK/MazF family toxin, partial [Nitratireductor sp.]